MQSSNAAWNLQFVAMKLRDAVRKSQLDTVEPFTAAHNRQHAAANHFDVTEKILNETANRFDVTAKIVNETANRFDETGRS